MPSHPIQIEAVAKDFQKLYVGLTAAGTAPDFPLTCGSPDSLFVSSGEQS